MNYRIVFMIEILWRSINLHKYEWFRSESFTFWSELSWVKKFLWNLDEISEKVQVGLSLAFNHLPIFSVLCNRKKAKGSTHKTESILLLFGKNWFNIEFDWKKAEWVVRFNCNSAETQNAENKSMKWGETDDRFSNASRRSEDLFNAGTQG